jgi:hypothetical protein
MIHSLISCAEHCNDVALLWRLLPQIKPRPLIIDRTLRYHCPERDVMRAAVPLGSSPSSAAAAAAASGACLAAAASRPDVTVSVAGLVGSQRQQQQQQLAGASDAVKGQAQVHIKYKCGPSPDVVQFLVWLYADASMAQPLEVWQVRPASQGWCCVFCSFAGVYGRHNGAVSCSACCWLLQVTTS